MQRKPVMGCGKLFLVLKMAGGEEYGQPLGVEMPPGRSITLKTA